MTRRENRRTRRAPIREERTQFLVVCGGAATEPDYFRGLKKERRNPAVRVVVEGKGVDPFRWFGSPHRSETAQTAMRSGASSTGVWALVQQVIWERSAKRPFAGRFPLPTVE
jgi:hypothetical protein